VVKGLHESANFSAGSFTGMIRSTGHPKRAISVNWGVAAVVYLIVGAILARLIFVAGRGGVHLGERRPGTPARPHGRHRMTMHIAFAPVSGTFHSTVKLALG